MREIESKGLMKIFALHTLLLCYMTLSCQFAEAVTVRFVGKSGQTFASFDVEADLSRSIGAFTLARLQEAQGQGLIRSFEAYEEGVISIDSLANDLELIGRTEVRAWGWCFSLNDVVPETMPDQTSFLTQADRLVWYYGYAHYQDGAWVAQCVPAPVPGTLR